MRHRIFIAINLPENIKKKLAEYQLKWPELPAKWTKKENLHITLVFLGYLLDEELLEVCKIVRETALKHFPFSIKLNRIVFGPPKKLPPRMVWLDGEQSKELGKLQKDLENSLFGPNFSGSKLDVRPYALHITLARIKTWELRNMESEEMPEINQEVNFNFEVSFVEVMESALKKGGPDYTILESCPLKN